MEKKLSAEPLVVNIKKSWARKIVKKKDYNVSLFNGEAVAPYMGWTFKPGTHKAKLMP